MMGAPTDQLGTLYSEEYMPSQPQFCEYSCAQLHILEYYGMKSNSIRIYIYRVMLCNCTFRISYVRLLDGSLEVYLRRVYFIFRMGRIHICLRGLY